MKKMSIIIGLAVLFLSLACIASAEYTTVQRGDCLSAIGRQLKVPWREIAKVNNIEPPYTIFVGQKLEIPYSNVIQAEVAPVRAAEYVEKIKSLQAQILELEKKMNENSKTQTQKKENLKAPAEVKKETAEIPSGEVKAAYKANVAADVKKEVIAPAAPESVKKSSVEKDQFSMYMSAGGWKSYDNEKKATGRYYSGKLRYRPFALNMFGHEVGVGGFLMGETGSGKSGIWDFDWKKGIIGPTLKIYGNSWDASTDVGWSRQWDKGVNDKQITDSLYIMQYINFEQRRSANKHWLPQTELMASGTIPYSAHRESTKPGKTYGKSLEPADKLVYGAELKQSIYDFNFDNHLRLTPGIMLGGGYEADNRYYKVGPFVKLAYYGQDILILDVFAKEKQKTDGGRYYASLMISVDGIFKAYKRANIAEAKPIDLKAVK